MEAKEELAEKRQEIKEKMDKTLVEAMLESQEDTKEDQVPNNASGGGMINVATKQKERNENDRIPDVDVAIPSVSQTVDRSEVSTSLIEQVQKESRQNIQRIQVIKVELCWSKW